MNINLTIFVLMGITAFAINFLGTYEIQQIQKRKAFLASCATVINVILANTLLYYFVQQPLYGIAEAIGAFLGTYLMIVYDKKTPLDNDILVPYVCNI